MKHNLSWDIIKEDITNDDSYDEIEKQSLNEYIDKLNHVLGKNIFDDFKYSYHPLFRYIINRVLWTKK